MLGTEQQKLLDALTLSASRDQLAWISGYVAGLLGKPLDSPNPSSSPLRKITIAYGTETGNSKKLATAFAARAKQQGLVPRLIGLDQYRVNDLAKEEYFLTIVSTQGEGDPPAAAKKFYDHIHSQDIGLSKLKYGVLALGDTSYPLFCKAGEDVDARLSKLGAQRLVPLQKCDTDFDEEAEAWFNSVLASLSQPGEEVAPAQHNSARKKTGKQWQKGIVISSINLNDEGSRKETYHLEIEAADVEYEPGDALGIIPQNDPQIVYSILEVANVDAQAVTAYQGLTLTVSELLRKKLSVIHLPERVVNKYATLVRQEIPSTRIGLLELLKIYPLPASEPFDRVLEILEPITPRLYSISSSPSAHPGEVHLTVAKNSFYVNEERKTGLCSGFVSGFQSGETVDFYIHSNRQFKLPSPETDLILIGPGTGIAPFRSFLAEREANGATGRNWLFFGDQHFVTDFLYQTEIQAWVSSGVLNRIDLAFSRDQEEKIYVQDRMLEKSRELHAWLEAGARVYICGALEPMSRDVLQTLIKIFQQEGGLGEVDAEAEVTRLREEERIVLDVY